MAEKVKRKDDFTIICKVPYTKFGYVVNGEFYCTLRDAAKTLGCTSAALSMYLHSKRKGDGIKIYRDIRTIYKNEKHKLSYALYNMYEIVNE